MIGIKYKSWLYSEWEMRKKEMPTSKKTTENKELTLKRPTLNAKIRASWVKCCHTVTISFRQFTKCHHNEPFAIQMSSWQTVHNLIKWRPNKAMTEEGGTHLVQKRASLLPIKGRQIDEKFVLLVDNCTSQQRKLSPHFTLTQKRNHSSQAQTIITSLPIYPGKKRIHKDLRSWCSSL